MSSRYNHKVIEKKWQDIWSEKKVFQTSKGFRSRYILDLPVISDTNTLTNHFDYKVYTQLFDQNVSSASFFFKAAKSITNEDIKLTERLFVPSKNLRGFERGKIGPIENNDYITINITDNGVGFSNKDGKELIKPYFTTKEKGSGLGLSIVNKIINDHNGTIIFLNQTNGAKVEIKLPINHGK